MALAPPPEVTARLAGRDGEAAKLAARILCDTARLLGARALVPVASAHVDGCLLHGEAGVLFAERLAAVAEPLDRARVAVPTTLNVGALDHASVDRVRHDGATRALARRMARAYEAMGCRPTWTCAPYQAGHRPAFGTHVAWGESNAVVFVNSVLGARTNRLGDFLDICCALTGHAPMIGLHEDDARRARIVLDVAGLSHRLRAEETFYPVLGALIGEVAGTTPAAVVGLPAETSEDRLKALGAAAASTGAVALIHVVGRTPEAPTLDAALRGLPAEATVRVDAAMIRATRDRLSTAAPGTPPQAIAIGSPHLSEEELADLAARLDGRRTRLPIYACTGRHAWRRLEADGRAKRLVEAGVVPVVDTCVVVAPILPDIADGAGVLMTNSGKFAFYAEANTGWHSLYGSLADCVETAVAGRLVRDESLWT